MNDFNFNRQKACVVVRDILDDMLDYCIVLT